VERVAKSGPWRFRDATEKIAWCGILGSAMEPVMSAISQQSWFRLLCTVI
jgi:hypothetical protein